MRVLIGWTKIIPVRKQKRSAMCWKIANILLNCARSSTYAFCLVDDSNQLVSTLFCHSVSHRKTTTSQSSYSQITDFMWISTKYPILVFPQLYWNTHTISENGVRSDWTLHWSRFSTNSEMNCACFASLLLPLKRFVVLASSFYNHPMMNSPCDGRYVQKHKTLFR